MTTAKVAFTVFYDDEFGELTNIVESERFHAESGLLRADVFSDAVQRLEDMQAQAFQSDVVTAAPQPRNDSHDEKETNDAL